MFAFLNLSTENDRAREFGIYEPVGKIDPSDAVNIDLLDLMGNEDAFLKTLADHRYRFILRDAERQNIVRTLLSGDPAEDNVGVAAVDTCR